MSQNRVENNLLYGPKAMEAQLACAQRQLRYMQMRYAKFVANGWLEECYAEEELGNMQAIVETLREIIASGELG